MIDTKRLRELAESLPHMAFTVDVPDSDWRSYRLVGRERFDDNGNDGHLHIHTEKKDEADYLVASSPPNILELLDTLDKYRAALERIADDNCHESPFAREALSK